MDLKIFAVYDGFTYTHYFEC